MMKSKLESQHESATRPLAHLFSLPRHSFRSSPHLISLKPHHHQPSLYNLDLQTPISKWQTQKSSMLYPQSPNLDTSSTAAVRIPTPPSPPLHPQHKLILTLVQRVHYHPKYESNMLLRRFERERGTQANCRGSSTANSAAPSRNARTGYRKTTLRCTTGSGLKVSPPPIRESCMILMR
jgi:hypothetical protein